MIKRLTIFLAAILIPMALAACNGSTPPSTASIGTLAWIDAPLNGSTLPLAPIEIVSHASDSTGITQVELSINGAIVRTDQNQAADQHLVLMSQAWTPPASGNYKLSVRAQNSNGGWSDYAQATITINGAPVPTAIPVSSPTSAPLVPSPTLPPPTLSVPSPTPAAQTGCRGIPAIGSFTVSAPTINAGEAAALNWDAIANAASIEIDNGIGSVGTSGGQSIAPATTTTYTLIARCGDQAATSQVTIRVAQPAATVVPTILTNPTIGTPAFSTHKIWYGLIGCGDTRVGVSVPVADPSGITGVTLVYRYADQAGSSYTEWKSLAMSDAGDGTYVATLDAPPGLPFSDGGLRVHFIATSANGGSTTSPTDKDNVLLAQCSKP